MISEPQGHAPHLASSRTQPEAAAFHFLKRLKLPCRLLVAYSGGGDSTGLLVALAALRADFPGIAIMAATVDHGLRPGSADEALKAGELCAALDIPHTVLTWPGDKPKTGIQAAARSARYRLLTEHAIHNKIDLILTAHNLEDQRETLAMRRTRSPDAMGGISDAVLVERAVWVVRPFLDVGREEIRAYLRRKGIGWIEDPSNDNPAFERVRVRQDLATATPEPDSRADVGSISHEAAEFIHSAVQLHPGHVAEVDLERLSPADPAHRLAMLSLVAFLGGRDHLAGKETAGRVFDFLARGEGMRLAAERVIQDRRGRSLFIGREARGLQQVTIAPGEAAYWDNRFHISNRGKAVAQIAAGDLETYPIIDSPQADRLPKSVYHRARITIPRLISGDPGAMRVRTIIPQCEHFLPSGRLELANSLAFVAGLEHFPSLSLG
ncbi:tRNA lysidine(34) synthetase TilS [Rhizobium sp. TH2]|uniref:tRNA lysidine(34) synthetase TilS n=1 Tax=Rhizobium sp. TH2 TaxID=2775403 RepID=UPI0021578C58|nr:tRNA lysidine(34) synthetase TilS [Rhizobium sp. TH2]UVC07382.1 tRNA lysidine(34) synthetase TilS [Rhizobium sp. TH2]